MYDMKALYQAKDVADAVSLRLAHPEAHIIAGGSDVLVQMREGKRAGVELISIYGLDELRGVTMEADGTIRIGETQIVPIAISSVSDRNNYQPIPYPEDSEGYERVLEKLNGTYSGSDVTPGYDYSKE